MSLSHAERRPHPAARERVLQRQRRKRRLSFFFYVCCGCAIFYFIVLAIGVKIIADLGLWPWGGP